jgi:hypothetical protein
MEIGEDVKACDLVGMRQGEDSVVRWYKAFGGLTGKGLATIEVTNGGSGYTSDPTVTITGGGGTGAAAGVTRVAGVITAVTVSNPGSGFTSVPTIGFSGGGGTGAAATAVLTAETYTQLEALGMVLKDMKAGAFDAVWDMARINGFKTDSGQLAGLVPPDAVWLSITVPGAAQRVVPTGTGKLKQFIGRAYRVSTARNKAGDKANGIRVRIERATTL